MSLEIPPIHYIVPNAPTGAQLPISTFPEHAEKGLALERGRLPLNQARNIKVSIIAMHLLDCSSGPDYQLPCDFSIIHQVKSLAKGKISLGAILDLGAQIILTVNTCAEYIKLLGLEHYLVAIPLGRVILCTAQLYTNIQKCIRILRGDEEVHDISLLRLILLKRIVSSIFCIAQILFYFYISPFAAPLQLFFAATLYLISTLDILYTEYYTTLSLSSKGDIRV